MWTFAFWGHAPNGSHVALSQHVLSCSYSFLHTEYGRDTKFTVCFFFCSVTAFSVGTSPIGAKFGKRRRQ